VKNASLNVARPCVRLRRSVAITKHLRERNFDANYVASRTIFRALNRERREFKSPKTRPYILPNNDFDFHDRFEKTGFASRACFPCSHRACNFERPFRLSRRRGSCHRSERRGDIYRGEACKNSGVSASRIPASMAAMTPWNGAADNLVERGACSLSNFPFARIVLAGNFLESSSISVGGELVHVFVIGARIDAAR